MRCGREAFGCGIHFDRRWIEINGRFCNLTIGDPRGLVCFFPIGSLPLTSFNAHQLIAILDENARSDRNRSIGDNHFSPFSTKSVPVGGICHLVQLGLINPTSATTLSVIVELPDHSCLFTAQTRKQTFFDCASVDDILCQIFSIHGATEVDSD